MGVAFAVLALNFPNKHPLCLSMDKESLTTTDLILGLPEQTARTFRASLADMNAAQAQGPAWCAGRTLSDF